MIKKQSIKTITLKRILAVLSDEDTMLRFSFPYLADKKCVQCHSDTNIGDILGVVDFYIDVLTYKNKSIELENVASKINLFNKEVIDKNKQLKEKNQLLIDLNKEIEETQTEILTTLGNVSESRSKETAYHVQNIFIEN
ncbi:MAG: hypothetical protein U9N02_08660 [Campylobacterota bacterium]|nr:hypothetical protein [Campylobacterota bacterium]